MSDSIARIDQIVNPFVHEVKKHIRGREEILIDLLHKKGATQDEIGQALGLSSSNISRYYPKKKDKTTEEK